MTSTIVPYYRPTADITKQIGTSLLSIASLNNKDDDNLTIASVKFIFFAALDTGHFPIFQPNRRNRRTT
jgi:hypothetical protein